MIVIVIVKRRRKLDGGGRVRDEGDTAVDETDVESAALGVGERDALLQLVGKVDKKLGSDVAIVGGVGRDGVVGRGSGLGGGRRRRRSTDLISLLTKKGLVLSSDVVDWSHVVV